MQQERWSWVLRIQAIAALALPWVVAHLIAPGLPVWSATAWSIALIFAALHRTAWQAWLVPVIGLASIATQVPPSLSGLLTIASGVFLALRPPAGRPSRHPAWQWSLAGALIALALVLTISTALSSRSSDLTFEQGQQAAAEAWDAPLIGGSTSPQGSEGSQAAPVVPVTKGPLAKLSFDRPGSSTPPVTARTLFVEQGISEDDLSRGPGHYPQTSLPGEAGNFAVAGHRTGWGSPFAELDELVPGDVITVTGQNRMQHRYIVESSEIVLPTDTWVLGPDPLGTGKPTLTLTTCDPPGINTHRLVVFATLADDDILALPAPN